MSHRPFFPLALYSLVLASVSDLGELPDLTSYLSFHLDLKPALSYIRKSKYLWPVRGQGTDLLRDQPNLKGEFFYAAT